MGQLLPERSTESTRAQHVADHNVLHGLFSDDTPEDGSVWTYDAEAGLYRPVTPASGTSLGFGSFPFDVSMHADLLVGVDTGIVVPDGAWIPLGMMILSLPVVWDGPGGPPVFSASTSQANAVGGFGVPFINESSLTVDGQDSPPGVTTNPVASNQSPIRVSGGDQSVWLAVTNALGGDVGGSTGTGLLFVSWFLPA